MAAKRDKKSEGGASTETPLTRVVDGLLEFTKTDGQPIRLRRSAVLGFEKARATLGCTLIHPGGRATLPIEFDEACLFLATSHDE